MKKEMKKVEMSMLPKFFAVCLTVAMSASSAFAWPWSSDKKDDAQAQQMIQDSLKREQLKTLQREVDALERIRMQKADALEKLEAEHWRKRYEESRITEEHQVASRELDSRYSKLSTDLGRVNDELTASRELSAEAEDKAKFDEQAYDALNTQIRLSIDKTLGEVAGDYPIALEERMLGLKKAAGESQKNNALGAAKIFLEDALSRQEKTYTQSLENKYSQVGNRADVEVTRLRLGTVFLGEVARDNGQVQALFRTGTLQGKMYEWNSTLPVSIANGIQNAISKSGSANSVEAPIDILQNKSIKNAISEVKETTWQEDLQAFFKKGGIVMYPLMLTAIFALLLSLERFLVLMIRGRLSKKFMKKIDAMVSEKKYDEAAQLCFKKNTSLSMVMFVVLNKASETREVAEKSLQEMLLWEQPRLERRMGLLAAMGSIAPLLGLLGTVTGIITLFTVITEVGTNDARVLAGGISEALVTTETGLVIAIPVMILHGLLSEKIEKLTSELYARSTSLLNKIFPKEG